jgi:hypothetical protein
VEPQQHRLALREAGRRPAPLRVARAPERLRHVVLAAARHPPEQTARERLLDVDPLALPRRGHAGRERVELRGGDAPRRDRPLLRREGAPDRLYGAHTQ